MKVYCQLCKEFTWHDFRKLVWCQRCRSYGNPYTVGLFIAVPIISFVYAVYRLWQGGGW